jgi:hypothetical protein
MTPAESEGPGPFGSPLQLSLQQRQDPPGWEADLQAEGAAPHFDSLQALIDWLVTLERPEYAATRGIR